MTYLISDIHGCYDKYIAMLDKINFKDRDILYVLGDVVDRGKRPIKVLLDMSSRSNVLPIMGNHDYIALIILEKLSAEITENNFETHIDEKFVEFISDWFADGGQTTLNEFKRLTEEERGYVLNYLRKFTPYEVIKANGKNFILTHAGAPKSATYDNLKNYDMLDFVTAKTDYDKIYFPDMFLVTGHTPTVLIDKNYEKKIYRKNNHIAIDTGAVFHGGVLACVCLETDEEFYV